MSIDRARFVSYALRTTEPERAHAFYAEVVSAELPPIGLLPEMARLRGAPAHWLGHVGVRSVGSIVTNFVARGGEQLGPLVKLGDDEMAVLRDPFGSVVAVRTASTRVTDAAEIGWHQLHTHDHERAFAFYEEMFGWRGVDALAHKDDRYLIFAWDSVAPPVGTIGNTANRHGVHPHWTYFFVVPDLDASLERAASGGGERTFGPFRRPNGTRVAVCHDPQGAEFGLMQRPEPTSA